MIGARHPKWDERPILLAIKNEGADVDEASVLEYLEGKIAKWWMPDAVIFVESLPHTATGKLLKIDLRKDYENYLIENAN